MNYLKLAATAAFAAVTATAFIGNHADAADMKAVPKATKAVAAKAPKMAAKAPSAAPGRCGTYKYFKAGKCVDKR